MGIVRHMIKVKNWDEKILPGLLVIVVLMAFGMGVMWTKLQSLEKGTGSPSANVVNNPANNAPAAAAPAPTNLEAGKFKELVEKGNPPTLGKSNAPVTIVEFSDLQCPFCKQFNDSTFPQIKKEYIDAGKVRLVYRHYPLRSIHPEAYNAALAAECAKEQNKFWEFHDETYLKQASLSVDVLKQVAQTVGLNTSKFNTCLDSEKYKSTVEEDENLGNSAGVNGTPAFFVNGTLVSGAQQFPFFKPLIDAGL
jgi:protein-disulfide isomerase